ARASCGPRCASGAARSVRRAEAVRGPGRSRRRTPRSRGGGRRCRYRPRRPHSRRRSGNHATGWRAWVRPRRPAGASVVPRLAAAAQHGAVAGVEFELEQHAIGAQQLELVDPGAILAFELDLDDLPRMPSRDPFEERVQRHDLAGFHGAPRPVMVVVGERKGSRAGQQQGQQELRGAHGKARWTLAAWWTRWGLYSAARLNGS